MTLDPGLIANIVQSNPRLMSLVNSYANLNAAPQPYYDPYLQYSAPPIQQPPIQPPQVQQVPLQTAQTNQAADLIAQINGYFESLGAVVKESSESNKALAAKIDALEQTVSALKRPDYSKSKIDSSAKS
jgi:hypothetical protein